MTSSTTGSIVAEVVRERAAQHRKWGQQNHPDGTGPDWVLLPAHTSPIRNHYAELAEAAKERTDQNAKTQSLSYADIFIEEVFEALAEDDPEKLRTELIQCAAIAVQWVEKIDRHATSRGDQVK